MTRDGDWRDDALCRQTLNPDDFFPEKGGDSGALAKQVCALCTVQAECRNFALSIGDDLLGIWGGTSHETRRRARKKAEAA